MLRALLASFVGALLTLLWCGGLVLAGLLGRLGVCFRILNRKQVHLALTRGVFLWGRCVYRLCYEKPLRVKSKVAGGIRPITENEVVVLISNHPSNFAAVPFMATLGEYVTCRFIVVGKHEHRWTPIGWALAAFDGIIFIDRSNPVASRESLRVFLKEVAAEGEPAVIVIFPDMHRPTEKGIKKDRKRFPRRGVPVVDWLFETRVPRPGGLEAMIDELSHTGKSIRVVNCTNAFNTCDHWVDGRSIIDATFYMTIEDFTLSSKPELIQECLNHEWKKKNVLISTWRS